jgi:Domain of unknown function (DUF4375)
MSGVADWKDWNRFVWLLATTDYADLSPFQRPPHLVFCYESEVQNGGHLQYFINRGDQRGEKTIRSLRALGADAQATIFEQALERWRSAARQAPADAAEYAALALEGEFDAFDRAFHACSLKLNDVLRRHLAEHQSEFIPREN